MKLVKLLIILCMIIMVGNMFAAYYTLTIRETQASTPTPVSTTLRNLVLTENPTYGISPNPISANRWVIQMYKSTDNVIDPLGSDNLPTGDDVVVSNYGGASTQGLVFAAVQSWLMSSVRFYDDGVTGNAWVGSKIYLRVFNSNAISTATKYLQSTALYTVPGANTVLAYVPTLPASTPAYGWSSWIPKNITPLVSGTISSTLSVSGVSVACTGMSSYLTNSSGTFNFSVTNGANITITPTKSGFSFTPPSRSYTNVQEAIANVNFTMTNNAPNTATNPVPAIDATNIAVNIGQLEWDYTALPSYSVPTGFKVYFPSDTATPVTVPYIEGVTHYTYEVPQLAYNTVYSWKVVPTNSNKGELVTEKVRSNNSKADATGAIIWSFTTKAATIIYPGINAGVDFDGGGSAGMFIFSTPSTAVEPGTPQIVYLVIPLDDVPELPATQWITSGYAMNMTAPTTTTLTVTVPAGTWYVSAYYNGRWNHGTPANPVIGPSQVVFEGLPFGGKGDIPIIFTEGPGDPTLPVTLSSFTAIYSVGFFVQLTWVVQSETNHLGYNILRSDDAVLANAVKINPSFVSSGSASGTQITYNYRDEEIIDNSTYNYWLESVDLDGTTHFFGPVNVIVNNDTPDVPPVIPTVTELLNAYPNPFNPMTLIPYTLKSKGEVKIDIYNVKGELVRNLINESKNAGTYQIPWNGKDSEGKSVSSGIYYYRMSSGKYTASKKIILVK